METGVVGRRRLCPRRSAVEVVPEHFRDARELLQGQADRHRGQGVRLVHERAPGLHERVAQRGVPVLELQREGRPWTPTQPHAGTQLLGEQRVAGLAELPQDGGGSDLGVQLDAQGLGELEDIAAVQHPTQEALAVRTSQTPDLLRIF